MCVSVCECLSVCMYVCVSVCVCVCVCVRERWREMACGGQRAASGCQFSLSTLIERQGLMLFMPVPVSLTGCELSRVFNPVCLSGLLSDVAINRFKFQNSDIS